MRNGSCVGPSSRRSAIYVAGLAAGCGVVTCGDDFPLSTFFVAELAKSSDGSLGDFRYEDLRQLSRSPGQGLLPVRGCGNTLPVPFLLNELVQDVQLLLFVEGRFVECREMFTTLDFTFAFQK